LIKNRQRGILADYNIQGGDDVDRIAYAMGTGPQADRGREEA